MAYHGVHAFYATESAALKRMQLEQHRGSAADLALLAYRTKVGGTLALNDLLNRRLADSAWLATSVIDFAFHHEVALLTLAINKVTQGTATCSNSFG
jgi:glycerol-3-phosphate dehydrogenase